MRKLSSKTKAKMSKTWLKKYEQGHLHPGQKYSFTKKEIVEALNKYESQARAAIAIKTSQMTISRYKRKYKIEFDGRGIANKDPINCEKKRQASVLWYKNNKHPSLGTKRPRELVEKLAAKLKGRPAWNKGIKKIKITICNICQREFEHSPKRERILCSRECSAIYMAKKYSDGRFNGSNNPNYGNGEAIKLAHQRGAYANRVLPNYTRGKGAFYNGVWMRSTWELGFAAALDALELHWQYEPKRFHLIDGRYYIPDFYILEYDVWIEIKGHWYSRAKQKFEIFLEQYPEVNIVVIEEELWKKPANDLNEFLLMRSACQKSIKSCSEMKLTQL